jgi:factor associated with neutral sphingomyelinase activation
MLQPAQQRRLKGQLRLCSRAIFFEPDYVQAPILMFPFSKIRAIERLPESLASPSASNSKWRNNSLEGFQLKTSLLVKMKENGVDAPYVFEKEDSIWWFSLEFSRVQSFLQQAQPLLAINALPFAERDMILQNAAAQREAQAQFDTSRLLDLSEQVLLDCPAAQVTPLVREPGRLVLTQARVYFQPLHNLTDSSPVRSQPYCNVVAVARRRHALRPTGMEVFFQEDPLARGPAGNGLGEDASAFFTFQNTQQRDMTISTLLEQLGGQHGAAASAGLLLEADSLWLQRVTTAWQVSLSFFFHFAIPM